MSILISQQLAAHIAADSTVTAITPRVYNGEPTDDTLIPLVIINRTELDSSPFRDTDGNKTKARYTYSIDCYGRTAQQTEELADAVVDAVDGFTSENVDECFYDRDYRNDSDDEYRTTVEIVLYGDR